MKVEYEIKGDNPNIQEAIEYYVDWFNRKSQSINNQRILGSMPTVLSDKGKIIFFWTFDSPLINHKKIGKEIAKFFKENNIGADIKINKIKD